MAPRQLLNLAPPSPLLGRILCRMTLVLALLVSMMAWVGVGTQQVAEANRGFSPNQYQNNLIYGQGVYFAPNRMALYAEPHDQADLVDILRWDRGGRSFTVYSEMRQAPLHASHVFLCFYPDMDVAMMAVIGDTADGWAEVVYDQRRNKTAWVKLGKEGALNALAYASSQANDTQTPLTSSASSGEPSLTHDPTIPASAQEAPPSQPWGEFKSEHSSAQTEVAPEDWPAHYGRYQSWLQFMRLNARHNGIYWLTGVDGYDRKLRTKPEDTSKLIETTYLKDIRVIHARGNWLLIEGKDFGGLRPIGWVRWRDEEGRLMVFTDFTGIHQITTTGM